MARVTELESDGHTQQVLDLLDQIQPGLEAQSSPWSRNMLAGLFVRRGNALDRLGDSDGALEAWDAALGMEATLTEKGQRRVAYAVEPRVRKARVLANRDRDEEAAALLDVALQKLETTLSNNRLKTSTAVNAALLQLQVLVKLERVEDAEDLVGRVMRIIGDDGDDTELVADEPSEYALANALAVELESVRTDRPFSGGALQWSAPEILAQRACELYRLSWPWLSNNRSATGLAAFCLQAIGDGYAVAAIAKAHPEHETRPGVELVSFWGELLAARDLTEWAADLGQPLPDLHELREPGVEDETSFIAADIDIDALEGQIRRVAEQLMYRYELLSLFLRSPAGRSVLQKAALSTYDEEMIYLRMVIGQLTRAGSPEGPLAIVSWCLFIMRGVFVVAHSTETPNHSFLPPPAFLRALLAEIDGYDWLINHGACLPAWVVGVDNRD